MNSVDFRRKMLGTTLVCKNPISKGSVSKNASRLHVRVRGYDCACKVELSAALCLVHQFSAEGRSENLVVVVVGGGGLVIWWA